MDSRVSLPAKLETVVAHLEDLSEVPTLSVVHQQVVKNMQNKNRLLFSILFNYFCYLKLVQKVKREETQDLTTPPCQVNCRVSRSHLGAGYLDPLASPKSEIRIDY